MPKEYIWSAHRNYHDKPAPKRSKRPFEHDLEFFQNMRKKVIVGALIFVFFYVIYLLFFSSFFQIKYLNISGTTSEPTDNLEKAVWQVLDRRVGLVLPGNNYFLLSTSHLANSLTEQNVLWQLDIKKKFPNSLNISVTEKLSRLIWVSNQQLYVLGMNGTLEQQIPNRDLSNIGLPVVYDATNTLAIINQPNFVNQELINLIIDIYTNFKSYNLPIDLDYFKVDGPQTDYVKVVAKKGFEIHFTYHKTFQSQMDKLKKSLDANKIDLNNISYINLRIEDQVIYK